VYCSDQRKFLHQNYVRILKTTMDHDDEVQEIENDQWNYLDGTPACGPDDPQVPRPGIIVRTPVWPPANGIQAEYLFLYFLGTNCGGCDEFLESISMVSKEAHQDDSTTGSADKTRREKEPNLPTAILSDSSNR
jgi:hypothetical protein